MKRTIILIFLSACSSGGIVTVHRDAGSDADADTEAVPPDPTVTVPMTTLDGGK